MDNELNHTPESTGMQRRQVMKAAAWAVPVVAVVASAPLAAASQSPDWFEAGNGSTGALNRSAGNNNLTGYVMAHYELIPLANGNIAVPPLTVTITRGQPVNNWATNGPWTLGPGYTPSTAPDPVFPAVGSTVTTPEGFVWQVASDNGTTLVFTSVTTSYPASNQYLRSPRVHTTGTATPGGVQAYLRIDMVGAPNSNETGGAWNATSI